MLKEKSPTINISKISLRSICRWLLSERREAVSACWKNIVVNNEKELPKCAPADKNLKKLISRSVRQHILNSSHHFPHFRRIGKRLMYDTIQGDYYWPNMASNVYKTVSNWPCSAKNFTKFRLKRHLQHVLVTGPFKICCYEYLRSTTKYNTNELANCNRYGLVLKTDTVRTKCQNNSDRRGVYVLTHGWLSTVCIIPSNFKRYTAAQQLLYNPLYQSQYKTYYHDWLSTGNQWTRRIQ